MALSPRCTFCRKLPAGGAVLVEQCDLFRGKGEELVACRDQKVCSDRLEEQGLGRRDWSDDEREDLLDTLRFLYEESVRVR